MFIVSVNGKCLASKNTLCREGAFLFLKGNLQYLAGILQPITGGPVSFYDTKASHPNWVINTDLVGGGSQLNWASPFTGNSASSVVVTYSVTVATVVDGFAFIGIGGSSGLFSATLLVSPLNLTPTDTVNIIFTYNGNLING